MVSIHFPALFWVYIFPIFMGILAKKCADSFFVRIKFKKAARAYSWACGCLTGGLCMAIAVIVLRNWAHR